ncbi:MAG: protein kinase [Planctomycetes bacterium]|nr:protein kinase [Planctomycetota bacterium]
MARIAVIDDNESMLKLLELTIKAPERDIVLYRHPEEALLDILKEPFDLVMTDLSMPRITGHEVIKSLRAKYSKEELPIIVISAVGLEEAIIKAFDLGADDYIVKPFKKGEVRSKVNLMLFKKDEGRPRADGDSEEHSILGKIGHFLLLELIGEGGMGAVYKAKDLESGRTVALKVLTEHIARDDRIRRFLREAAILKEVDHPNITRFYEIHRDNDRYFFSMEFVDGKDLEDFVDAGKRFTEAQAIDFLIQAASALDYLQGKNMVHRDIKPSNFLFDEGTGNFKLTDFGLTIREHDERFTEDGILMGTLEYFAPEQITGELSVDIRSDIFSLGSTVYFVLAGTYAFNDPEDRKVLHLVARAKPTPLEDHRSDLSKEFHAIIKKMMMRKPADRFASPAELIKALEKIKK